MKLAESLAALEAGHRLILEARQEDSYYVQFASDGADGYRVEAVSNRFLQGWKRLDAIAENRLRRLGWRPPTDIGDGPVNWWMEYPAGTPTERIAELAIATLRKVYEVPRPIGLVYWAFARSGEEILLPTLGIERRPKTPPLEQRVEAALREFLQVDELVRDDDGDWPVRSDEAMVYLRVVSEPAHVTVFSPILLGTPSSPALLDAVNDINNTIRVARAIAMNDGVMLAADVYDQPHIEDGVIHAFKAVSSLANEMSGDLQSRFGGPTQFGAPPDPGPEPARELGYGGYL